PPAHSVPSVVHHDHGRSQPHGWSREAGDFIHGAAGGQTVQNDTVRLGFSAEGANSTGSKGKGAGRRTPGAGRPILLCWTTARPYSSSQSPCASSNRRTASSKHHSLRIARQLTSVTLRRRTPDRSELAAAASFAVPVVASAAFARSPTAGLIVAV